MQPVLHPIASAAGKIILVGEHAAVYGHPALAAALPDALTLQASPTADPHAPLRLRLPAWDLDLDLDEPHPVARACTAVLRFCDGPQRGWTIAGKTTLPAGAGLGSSAALTVAVARLALGPDADLEPIRAASMCGERIFHGSPSGIDTEVAARGGMLQFVRGSPASVVSFSGPLELCVVPSGIPRRTADQVAKVSDRHKRLPLLAEPILRTLGATVPEAITAIEGHDLARLGEVFNVAHGLLGALGVSSPQLDALCATARAAGAYGAKLTGAGGGGCIVCVPPDDPQPLFAMFSSNGFEPRMVTLNASEIRS